MALCPRCNANVPEGNERCLVCGYGLPGTSAAREDPKDTPPARGAVAPAGPNTELVETGAAAEEPIAATGEPGGAAGEPSAGSAGLPTQPGGSPLFETTEQQPVADAGATGTLASDRAAAPSAMERTSIMPTPVPVGFEAPGEPTEPIGAAQRRRRFPVNTVLVLGVAAVAIAVLVFALTSGSGTTNRPPKSSTTSTTRGHVVIPASSTTSTTSASTTTSSTVPSSTSTTRTTSAPTSTTGSTTTSTSTPPSSTTSTTTPSTTSTTTAPTTTSTLS